MRAYSLLFLCLLAGMFFISGCNNSSGSGRSAETGTAAFKIQWPDQVNHESAIASNRIEKTKSLAVNERSIQADLSEECEARKVAEVQVEVRDDHDRHLVSKSFACEVGAGEVEGIAVGANRRFILSGLDANGHERYHGEKAGVEIKSGVNEVGMIEIADVTSAPNVKITAPSDGSLHTSGSEISFECSAADPEDGALSGEMLVWSSDIDGQFGTGTTVPIANLSQGIHNITLTAADSDGATSTDSITVTVNDKPVVVIEEPIDEAMFTQGTEVVFNGSATDTEDGELTGDALVWTSSLDEQIGTGATFSINNLAAGTHTVRLTATDSDGATNSARITLMINAGPGAVIAEPLDNSVYNEGAEVVFSGSATDIEDGELAGDALVWTSSLDEQIGTSGSFATSSLSAGTHTIALTATDSDGATSTTKIELIINAIPAVTIKRPYDGSVHAQNGNIYFDGSATDPEDGTISNQTGPVWTSDIDGPIGYGSAFIVSSLSSGKHQITLTATDSRGAISSDSVSITVIEPRLPDTGQTQSYTTTYGEDADYQIHPPSYTKLNENGKALSPTANAWSMVRDNITGLTWEVKTTDGSIHEVEDTYTWSNAKTIFIENLNIAGFGGFTDWRLPTVMELYTIVSGAYADLALNQNYFPNGPDTNEPWYWSSTPMAWRFDSPWVIDFTSGEAAGYEGTNYYVRAVRGPQLNVGRFVDNGDGTVTDTLTGLMWQQELEEYQSTWELQLDFCEKLSLAGYNDWRMPNRHELHTLVDYTRSDPAFDTSIFQHSTAVTSRYWTATTDPGNPDDAYVISFYYGYGYYQFKSDAVYYPGIVRAVRGPE